MWCVVALAVLGIILIIVSSVGENSDTKKQSGDEISLEEYKEQLESELMSLCADVEGAGKCRVFITFERGAQKVYKSSAVVEIKPPKVLGVTVISKGAGSDEVRKELTDMITALFDIGANRVAILKLNS